MVGKHRLVGGIGAEASGLFVDCPETTQLGIALTAAISPKRNPAEFIDGSEYFGGSFFSAVLKFDSGLRVPTEDLKVPLQ